MVGHIFSMNHTRLMKSFAMCDDVTQKMTKNVIFATAAMAPVHGDVLVVFAFALPFRQLQMNGRAIQWLR